MAVSNTLVIGFGNTIRTDDNAGIWIAEQLSALHLSGVVVQTQHQLSLDLLEEFHSFSRLLFIDAAAKGEAIIFEKVGRSERAIPPSTHHLTPADLIRMYEQLYGEMIEAFFCTVLGDFFDFGTELSPKGRLRAEKAVQILADFLRAN
ncbi:MAG: hydrogenase maturation protease [Desulfobulbaceae bacterium]|nr:hydrogenase maturation protease [Desulfobulbaceae bacterium]